MASKTRHRYSLRELARLVMYSKYSPKAFIPIYEISPLSSSSSWTLALVLPMALPVIKIVTDCVKLEKTVVPYIPQLYDLPQQVLQTLSSPRGLVFLYAATNPLITAFALSLFLAPIFLVVSEINKNYSQIDRFWSLLPTVYNAHYALYAHVTGLPTGRLDTLLGASILWSVRHVTTKRESDAKVT